MDHRRLRGIFSFGFVAEHRIHHAVNDTLIRPDQFMKEIALSGKDARNQSVFLCFAVRFAIHRLAHDATVPHGSKIVCIFSGTAFAAQSW